MSERAPAPAGMMLDELRGISEVARRALEPGLAQDSKGNVVSEGSCLYACLLLASMLMQFTKLRVGIRGGSGTAGAGALGRDGLRHGHFWLVVMGFEGCREEVVVDITGDQFGHDRVTVMRSHDAMHRYAPGEQDDVDAQASQVIDSIPLDGLAVRDGWFVKAAGDLAVG